MKQVTGCDAVMIGRGAIANPWVFSRLDRDQVPPEAVQEVVRAHLARNIQFYGEADGRRLFRKHAVQYLLMQSLSRETRKKILRERPAEEFVTFISQIYAATQGGEATVEDTITAG